MSILALLRPKQWVKNAFVLAPLFFAQQYGDIISVKNALTATVIFILISSATYVLNDIIDRKVDRNHPKKKHRPIAAGKISLPQAVVTMAILILSGAFISWKSLPPECLYIISIYFCLNIAYTFYLKHIAILDVLVIAVGFVLRVLLGGYAISVAISPWIIIATFTLALFLGFGKRRRELQNENNKTRASLDNYSKELLDKLITLSCTTAFLTYALYTVETAERTGANALVYTAVFVAFGLFRYLQHLYVDKEGEEPEQIIYHDPIFILNIFSWLAVTMWILK